MMKKSSNATDKRKHELIAKSFQPATVNLVGEREFKPLQKKIKNVGNRNESNYVQSYYRSSSSIDSIPTEDINRLLQLNDIKVEGAGVPRPILYFTDLPIPEAFISILTYHNIVEPTPIQMQGIPSVMLGRDVLLLAQTGTGKTISFLLPLAAKLMTVPPSNEFGKPLALILAPTRELVDQLLKDCSIFFNVVGSIDPNFPFVPNDPPYVFGYSLDTKGYSLNGVLCGNGKLRHNVMGCCGGTKVDYNKNIIISNPIDILVSTPGRLLDLIDKNIISLNNINYIVMDEADKMLDLGMENQLRTIINFIPRFGRQTIISSATMPIGIERLCLSAVTNEIKIYIAMGSKKSGKMAVNVKQNIIYVDSNYDKYKTLLDVIRRTKYPPVLIFVNSIPAVENLVYKLRQEQFHVAGLHSELDQQIRFLIMEAFKQDCIDILVSTDLASRGIDFTNVKHVIIYEMPHTIEDYIHRCGRTGRAGKKGIVTSFLTNNCKISDELRLYLKENNEKIPPELLNSKLFDS